MDLLLDTNVTFNAKDFARFTDLNVLVPSELAAAGAIRRQP
jgi:hypothetical protein